jgi:ABC-2 type transport system ATP-binding protein
MNNTGANNNIIEVKNLVKEFKGLKAVDGITFSVREDEIFGFLGPNGAGKTTTINMHASINDIRRSYFKWL